MDVQQKLQIGPSTGWLYARNMYFLSDQMAFIRAAGANTAEVCLAGWGTPENDKRISFLPGNEGLCNELRYRSLHLFDVSSHNLDRQIAFAKFTSELWHASTALTHPLKEANDEYPMASYMAMMSVGVPLALENMDSQKTSGFDLAELQRLILITGCRFVLDVQHAYEHDHSMGYANDLFFAFRGRLAHLHVSGETASNPHTLVHKANNAAQIVAFVGRVLSVKNVPLILEGEYTTPEELRQEIEFLARELGYSLAD